MTRHLLLLAPFLLACASGGSSASSTVPNREVISMGNIEVERYVDRRGTTHRIPMAVAEVWPSLVASYQAMEIPLGTVNRPAGVLGNTKLVVTRRLAGQRLSQLLNCGATVVGAPVADSHRIEVSVLSELTAVSATESSLQTRLTAQALSGGTSTAPIQCVSSGAFEELLLKHVMLHLAREMAPGGSAID